MKAVVQIRRDFVHKADRSVRVLARFANVLLQAHRRVAAHIQIPLVYFATIVLIHMAA